MKKTVVEVSVPEGMVNKKLKFNLLLIKRWSGVEELWEVLYSNGPLFFRFSNLTISWDWTVLVLMDLTYFELCEGKI